MESENGSGERREILSQLRAVLKCGRGVMVADLRREPMIEEKSSSLHGAIQFERG